MASNDPTDTGGLFVGRRPGTAPVRYRDAPTSGGFARRLADKGLAWVLLAIELVLCISVWGPQPLFWLWFGSYVDYWTGLVSAGIVSAFAGIMLSLVITLQVISTLRVFSQIYIMTNGGPAGASASVIQYVYQIGFSKYQLGYAASLSLMLFATILVVTFVELRVFRERSW